MKGVGRGEPSRASYSSGISHWSGFGRGGKRGCIRQKRKNSSLCFGVKTSELEVGWDTGMGEGHLVGDLQDFHLHSHAGHPLGSEGAKAGRGGAVPELGATGDSRVLCPDSIPKN